MELKQAIEILKSHNEWRRNDEVPNSKEMANPKELGTAIDKAVSELNQITYMRYPQKNIIPNYLILTTMINELSKEIHLNSKNKGLFDSEKNIGEMLALIHLEVSEALEADRKEMYAVKRWDIGRDIDLSHMNSTSQKQYFQQTFEFTIKNSFEDELADLIVFFGVSMGVGSIILFLVYIISYLLGERLKDTQRPFKSIQTCISTIGLSFNKISMFFNYIF